MIDFKKLEQDYIEATPSESGEVKKTKSKSTKERKSKMKIPEFKRIFNPDFKLKDKPEQMDVALDILERLKVKDTVIVEAPTGWGKTGLAYQIYNQSEHWVVNEETNEREKKPYRVLILNHNNKLLDQYINLLEKNVKDCISIKGKKNYFCSKNPLVSVDLAECRGCKRCRSIDGEKTPSCEYYARKFLSDKLDLVISNYHQQFSRIDVGDPIKKFDVIVCDECHNLEKILVDYATVKMNNSLVKDIVKELDNTDEYYSKKSKNKAKNEDIDEESIDHKALLWSQFRPRARDFIKSLYEDIEGTNSINYTEMFDRFYRHLNSLIEYTVSGESKSVLQSCVPSLYTTLTSLYGSYQVYKDASSNYRDRYIYEEDIYEKAYALVPLSVKSFFRKYVLSITDKLVLMSATVINPDNMMTDLGLDKERSEVMVLESKVPKTSRPIYTLCNCSIDIKDSQYSNSEDFKFLMDQIDMILKQMEDEKYSGFIYCNSYKLADMVYTELRHRGSTWNILMNTSSKDADYILEKFRDTSTDKRLLISCSFTEGVNFEDDISRFQIIVKVPFLYLGSARNKEKKIINPRWYTNKAIEQVIQAAGRSVRSPEDFAATYILDKSFKSAYRRYKDDYPRWFNEALIEI